QAQRVLGPHPPVDHRLGGRQAAVAVPHRRGLGQRGRGTARLLRGVRPPGSGPGPREHRRRDQYRPAGPDVPHRPHSVLRSSARADPGPIRGNPSGRRRTGRARGPAAAPVCHTPYRPGPPTGAAIGAERGGAHATRTGRRPDHRRAPEVPQAARGRGHRRPGRAEPETGRPLPARRRREPLLGPAPVLRLRAHPVPAQVGPRPRGARPPPGRGPRTRLLLLLGGLRGGRPARCARGRLSPRRAAELGERASTDRAADRTAGGVAGPVPLHSRGRLQATSSASRPVRANGRTWWVEASTRAISSRSAGVKPSFRQNGPERRLNSQARSAPRSAARRTAYSASRPPSPVWRESGRTATLRTSTWRPPPPAPKPALA